MEIGIKIKWNAWCPFLFPSDQALRRGPPCFLLFPCTMAVFTGRGTVCTALPSAVMLHPPVLCHPQEPSQEPSLGRQSRSDRFGAGSSQDNLLCSNPGEGKTVPSAHNMCPLFAIIIGASQVLCILVRNMERWPPYRNCKPVLPPKTLAWLHLLFFKQSLSSLFLKASLSVGPS